MNLCHSNSLGQICNKPRSFLSSPLGLLSLLYFSCCCISYPTSLKQVTGFPPYSFLDFLSQITEILCCDSLRDWWHKVHRSWTGGKTAVVNISIASSCTRLGSSPREAMQTPLHILLPEAPGFLSRMPFREQPYCFWQDGQSTRAVQYKCPFLRIYIGHPRAGKCLRQGFLHASLFLYLQFAPLPGWPPLSHWWLIGYTIICIGHVSV